MPNVDVNKASHIIVIKRSNYERLINGEPLLFDGNNFGIDKNITIVFAENEEAAIKQMEGTDFAVRRTQL